MNHEIRDTVSRSWKQPWPLSGSNYKLDYVIGDGMFGLVWKGHVFD